ncbi:MAG: hypothetical protein K8U57_26260 [Planctomycetes bacterium]|nr:hypothetical protein [Planctomycetota bacterium]
MTKFLQRRRVKKIHHIDCSHMDNDHAAGLLRLVQNGDFEIGCGWVHRPELHVDMDAVRGTMRKAVRFQESRVITNSLDRQMSLASTLICLPCSRTSHWSTPSSALVVGSRTPALRLKPFVPPANQERRIGFTRNPWLGLVV